MAAGLGAKVAGSDIHYSVPCNMQYVFVVLWFAVAIFYVVTDQRSSNVLKRWIRIANGVATAQPRSSSPTIEKISNLIKTSGLRERWMFFLCFVKSFKTTFLSPHSWKFWRHCAWRCKSSALNCSERSLVLAVSCVFSFLLAYLQSLQSSSFQPHFLVGQPFIRQDVRDLVELTVDRMDVYHLVPWFVGRILCFLEIKFCHIYLLILFRLCQNVVSTLTV